MKFSKKRLQLFGISLVLPIITKIQRKLDADRSNLLRGHRVEMANCRICHRHMSVKAGLSFLKHIQTEHKVSDSDSYLIAEDLWRKMLTASREARLSHGHSN
jgi:hypothetical protein